MSYLKSHQKSRQNYSKSQQHDDYQNKVEFNIQKFEQLKITNNDVEKNIKNLFNVVKEEYNHLDLSKNSQKKYQLEKSSEFLYYLAHSFQNQNFNHNYLQLVKNKIKNQQREKARNERSKSNHQDKKRRQQAEKSYYKLIDTIHQAKRIQTSDEKRKYAEIFKREIPSCKKYKYQNQYQEKSYEWFNDFKSTQHCFNLMIHSIKENQSTVNNLSMHINILTQSTLVYQKLIRQLKLNEKIAPYQKLRLKGLDQQTFRQLYANSFKDWVEELNDVGEREVYEHSLQIDRLISIIKHEVSEMEFKRRKWHKKEKNGAGCGPDNCVIY